MNEPSQPLNELIHALKERAKELNCLYEVQELLGPPGRTAEEICQGLILVLPYGWQYPDVCKVKVSIGGVSAQSPLLIETAWVQRADILIQEELAGAISVYYTQERPLSDEGPFLKEERKLIDTIAEQVGFYLLHQQLRQVFQQQQKNGEIPRNEWQVILDLLKRTDPGLMMRITRKMVNYLVWIGAGEAEHLLDTLWPAHREIGVLLETNQPYATPLAGSLLQLTDEVFAIAGRHLPREAILDQIQKWIKEDRSSFMINTLVNPGSSLAEINAAVDRFHLLSAQGIELASPRERWFKVALIRRILNGEPGFIRTACRHLEIDDFSEFLHYVIYPANSHGKLGGKSSGLFLAEKVLRRSPQDQEFLHAVKTPRTWYLTSDCIFYFMNYNNLEDVVEQKYKDASQIRQEYPYIVHIFKNSPLPPEIVKGLTMILEECRDVPLIVRSSSLLEDQSGQAFAGKYKSLFIANRGTKEERLAELMDAVTEVFASLFGPDPLEYRAEHGLLDTHEEMGILIQEVVGTQVGPYYLPAFAGIAFSRNEYRWSSRIRREDGLVRLVPGLGTRAVDRLSDDYPILVSPGQPGLRANVAPDEIAAYSPKKVDVINLETRVFETVDVRGLLNGYAQEYPFLNQIVSILSGDYIYHYQHHRAGLDPETSTYLVTFEGLLSRTPFLKQIHAVMARLEGAFGHPIDIEFAHDGKDLYLLQCRSQSYGQQAAPAEIPAHILPEQLIFTAHRYVPNGALEGIRYVVYVDPQGYGDLSDHQELLKVGRTVGRLNKLLPRRQFILMGPGRWGSRGDIKLGVSVTYADINNTLMLVEIGRRQNGYIPDLSFGTHFFQDLVEADIRYLPLYPDDAGEIFNEDFLTRSPNCLPTILPEFGTLSGVVRVIDVASVSGGGTLQVLMNSDLGQAVAVIHQSEKR